MESLESWTIPMLGSLCFLAGNSSWLLILQTRSVNELEEFTCCVCSSNSQMLKYFRKRFPVQMNARERWDGLASGKLWVLLTQPNYVNRFIIINKDI